MELVWGGLEERLVRKWEIGFLNWGKYYKWFFRVKVVREGEVSNFRGKFIYYILGGEWVYLFVLFFYGVRLGVKFF